MDASQWRGVNQGMWRGHGGFELSLSPVLFALIGLWIDRSVGTTPLFVVVFAVAGFAGAAIKLYYGYRASMEAASAARRDTTSSDPAAEPPSRTVSS